MTRHEKLDQEGLSFLRCWWVELLLESISKLTFFFALIAAIQGSVRVLSRARCCLARRQGTLDRFRSLP